MTYDADEPRSIQDVKFEDFETHFRLIH
jgi:hypothetical protein